MSSDRVSEEWLRLNRYGDISADSIKREEGILKSVAPPVTQRRVLIRR